MPAATASGADSKPNGTAKSRDHNQGNQDRKYTVEQKSAVLRVRRCSPTAFYDILGLEEVKTTVTDTEIKKAYRKLSLLTHPDKNGHEHADEAFKMVSRAFGVLGDAEKKAKFDKYGGDPDSRFGGGAPQPSPFSGFGGRTPSSRAGGGGSMWEEEISPEEMFNRFFGGGGGGFGGFGGKSPTHRSRDRRRETDLNLQAVECSTLRRNLSLTWEGVLGSEFTSSEEQDLEEDHEIQMRPQSLQRPYRQGSWGCYPCFLS